MHRGTAAGVSPSALVLSSAIPPRARARISQLGTHHIANSAVWHFTSAVPLCLWGHTPSCSDLVGISIDSDSVNRAAIFVLLHFGNMQRGPADGAVSRQHRGHPPLCSEPAGFFVGSDFVNPAAVSVLLHL